MLRNLDESGRITWASKVKNLLFRNGFGYVWHVEDVGDQTLFMRTVKQRLIDCSKQDCLQLLPNQVKQDIIDLLCHS